jgi:hypothetical protein
LISPPTLPLNTRKHPINAQYTFAKHPLNTGLAKMGSDDKKGTMSEARAKAEAGIEASKGKK